VASGGDTLRRNIAKRRRGELREISAISSFGEALCGLSRARHYAALWEIAYTANKEIARRDKEPERVTLMNAPPSSVLCAPPL
jgi:hypothetical protein